MRKMYEWGRRELKRIEILGPEDTEKKPPIPSESNFAKMHQKHIDKRTRKKK